MNVLISGASGLLGRALAAALERDGHQIIALTHSAGLPGKPKIRWNPEAGELDVAELAALGKLDAVINLAGENLMGQRWDINFKRRLRDSRIVGTYTLATALAALPEPPDAFLSASAIGYYGHHEGEDLSEASPPGDDFLATLCRDWEGATFPAEQAGIRTVHLRIGIVQTAGGGALAKALPLFRLGLGGPMGSGRQWVSWIALPDLVDAVLFLLQTPQLTGPFNLTAPNPVTNAGHARALGRALHRPALLPVPSFALRLALGEMAETLLQPGQRALPRRLLDAGFAFRFPEIDDALREALRNDAQR